MYIKMDTHSRWMFAAGTREPQNKNDINTVIVMKDDKVVNHV